MARNTHIGIREVDGLTIIFWDSRTIYVKTTFGNWVVFHRWFHIQRNFCTNNFKPFSKKLRHNKHLTYTFIAQTAVEHDITIASARQPDLTGKTIKYLPSKGRNRNKED